MKRLQSWRFKRNGAARQQPEKTWNMLWIFLWFHSWQFTPQHLSLNPGRRRALLSFTSLHHISSLHLFIKHGCQADQHEQQPCSSFLIVSGPLSGVAARLGLGKIFQPQSCFLSRVSLCGQLHPSRPAASSPHLTLAPRPEEKMLRPSRWSQHVHFGDLVCTSDHVHGICIVINLKMFAWFRPGAFSCVFINSSLATEKLTPLLSLGRSCWLNPPNRTASSAEKHLFTDE